MTTYRFLLLEAVKKLIDDREHEFHEPIGFVDVRMNTCPDRNGSFIPTMISLKDGRLAIYAAEWSPLYEGTYVIREPVDAGPIYTQPFPVTT